MLKIFLFSGVYFVPALTETSRFYRFPYKNDFLQDCQSFWAEQKVVEIGIKDNKPSPSYQSRFADVYLVLILENLAN